MWVYIREAHAKESARPANHVDIAQPKTFDERKKVAVQCTAAIKLTIPMVIDDMENSVSKAYNAMPDRLFVLGADGKIAYQGKRGPRGLDVDEMERALRRILAKKG